MPAVSRKRLDTTHCDISASIIPRIREVFHQPMAIRNSFPAVLARPLTADCRPLGLRARSAPGASAVPPPRDLLAAPVFPPPLPSRRRLRNPRPLSSARPGRDREPVPTGSYWPGRGDGDAGKCTEDRYIRRSGSATERFTRECRWFGFGVDAPLYHHAGLERRGHDRSGH